MPCKIKGKPMAFANQTKRFPFFNKCLDDTKSAKRIVLRQSYMNYLLAWQHQWLQEDLIYWHSTGHLLEWAFLLRLCCQPTSTWDWFGESQLSLLTWHLLNSNFERAVSSRRAVFRLGSNGNFKLRSKTYWISWYVGKTLGGGGRGQ